MAKATDTKADNTTAEELNDTLEGKIEDDTTPQDDTTPAKNSSSADNNSTHTDDTIDTLHEQNVEELEKNLNSKEKAADYQKKQKEKRAADARTEETTSSKSGFLLPLALSAVIAGFLFLLVKKQGKSGVSTSSDSKKEETAEKRTVERDSKQTQSTEQISRPISELW